MGFDAVEALAPFTVQRQGPPGAPQQALDQGPGLVADGVEELVSVPGVVDELGPAHGGLTTIDAAVVGPAR